MSDDRFNEVEFEDPEDMSAFDDDSGGTVVLEIPDEMDEISEEVAWDEEPVSHQGEDEFGMDDSVAWQEDSIDDEKTAMIEIPDFDSLAVDSTPPPPQISLPPGRLVVSLGHDQGQEYVLSSPHSVVGRGLDCDIILTDPTVSRRHFHVELEGDDWVLIDLGSGNGTHVNGELAQEVVLADGMQIEIGQTLLEFRQFQEMTSTADADFDDGDEATQAIDINELVLPPEFSSEPAPQPQIPQDTEPRYEEECEEAPPPRSKGIPWWVWVVGGVSLLAVTFVVLQFVVGVDFTGSKKKEVARQQELLAQQAAEEEERQERKAEGHDRYNDGMMAMRAKELAKAEGFFKEAVELDPDHEEAARALERIETERDNASSFKSIQDALKADNKEEAEKILKKIPEDSLFYADSKSAIESYVDEQVEKEIAAIRELLEKKQKDEARDTYEFVLELYPGHKALKALAEELK